MLTLAEEMLLLAYDQEHRQFLDIPEPMLHAALAGAVLMELAMLNRIDTDLRELTLVDRSPTGEPVLDHVLDRIADGRGDRSTAEWLDRLRADGPAIRQGTLERLLERGVLRHERSRSFWIFESHCYPLADGKPQQEVKRRIAALLLSDDIPDPRDAMIIALAEACGLLRRIFSEEELRRAQGRVRQIVRFDLIGRTVSSAVEDLQSLVARMAGYSAFAA